MAKILYCKEIAETIKQEIKQNTEKLIAEKGIRPGLAILLVGNDPGSKAYVNSKERTCKELGFHSLIRREEENFSEEEVIKLVKTWNEDDSIHGILVQLPLPKHINERKVIETILPRKDVDGFHPENVGRLVIGLDSFVPCTPAGIIELIRREKIETKGKHVVVAGRSNIVGKPIANLLLQKKENANAIVTICHTAAKDLKQYTRQADILIAAMGAPELIDSDYLKDDVVIIDVGYNRVEDKKEAKGYRIAGDVHFEDAKAKAAAITPVPGGVGLMTIAMLMLNTLKAAAGEIQF
ncbi:MAG: bifunctional 5,10-methylenetetrahydrofolate dehydrogenase/5,10-methenyltetrahydrofolate cyclohydrolase [Ignavibacteria bacterium]|nr:bifunctional 5,10-methylenetetrahydrofolate dehydrogenase/5,10-methenyltetrahydrofolate cyclohydrolase [Ignavibacteria bacterium]